MKTFWTMLTDADQWGVEASDDDGWGGGQEDEASEASEHDDGGGLHSTILSRYASLSEVRRAERQQRPSTPWSK